VTDEAIRTAAFGLDLESLTDLSFANKGVDDLGAIATLRNLQNVNLAFNNLISISALEGMAHLRCLNLMHNALQSNGIHALGTLPSLEVLKLSHNKLATLTPLAACSSLAELWVSHNSLSKLSDLDPLAACTKLQRLAFHPNMACTKGMKSFDYRSAVRAHLPQLQMLDGQTFTQEEITAAAKPKDNPKESHAANSDQCISSLPPVPRAGRRARGVASAAPARHKALPRPGLRSARSHQNRAAPAGAPESEGAVAATMRQLSESRDRANRSIFESSSRSSALPDLKAASGPPSPNSPTTSSPSARTGSSRSAMQSASSRVVNAQEYTSYYGEGSRAPAVSVRADGGAWAKWPNSNLAVSVDLEGPASSNKRSKGLVRSRMFAAYRQTGMVAVSFDPGGGFVNYPTGHLAFMYSVENGSGQLYDFIGNPTVSWNESQGGKRTDSVEILLDAHLGFRFKMPEKQPQIYFVCDAIMHKFVSGFNPPLLVWDNLDKDDSPKFLQELVRSGNAAAQIESRRETDSGRVRRRPRDVMPDTRPFEDRLGDIRSVTAGLQELDSKLAKWLEVKVTTK